MAVFYARVGLMRTAISVPVFRSDRAGDVGCVRFRPLPPTALLHQEAHRLASMMMTACGPPTPAKRPTGRHVSAEWTHTALGHHLVL